MNTHDTAYTVVQSSSTYGTATPYAVVSTASGMPHLPTHRSQEEARCAAEQLNEEARRAAEARALVARRKAARLRVEALKHDAAGADEAGA